MDKFLSGLGIGNFFGANSGAPAQKPSPSPSNGSLNQRQMDEIPLPKPQDTQLPNKPAKVGNIRAHCVLKYRFLIIRKKVYIGL